MHSSTYEGIYWYNARQCLLYIERNHTGQYTERHGQSLLNTTVSEEDIQKDLRRNWYWKLGKHNLNIMKYLYE